MEIITGHNSIYSKGGVLCTKDYLVEETFDVKFSFKYKLAKEKVDFLELEAEDINFYEVNIILKK